MLPKFSAVLRLALCLVAPLFLSACCGARYVPAVEQTFKKDGTGGIYFDSGHRAQAVHPGMKDVIVQGHLEDSETYFLLHYPQDIQEKADAAVKSAAAGVIGKYILDNAYEFEPECAATGANDAADEEPMPARLYPALITYEVTETGGDALSVRFRTWSYHGGAHDNWTYSAVSVNRRTGETITLDRLFRGAKSLERAARWLSEGKKATRDARSGPGGPVTAEPLRITVSPAEITMERIALTPEGMEILFSPYEKGSFAMGDVTARIPRKEFGRLGINPEFWGR